MESEGTNYPFVFEVHFQMTVFASTIEEIKNAELRTVLNKSAIDYILIPEYYKESVIVSMVNVLFTLQTCLTILVGPFFPLTIIYYVHTHTQAQITSCTSW